MISAKAQMPPPRSNGALKVSLENFAQSSPSSPHEAGLTSEKIARAVTRYDLATAIMKRLPHVSRRKASDIVDCALEEIAEALLQPGGCVKLHEFGTLYVCEGRKRAGRAPLPVEGASPLHRKVIQFRASRLMKDRLEKAPARDMARLSYSVEEARVRRQESAKLRLRKGGAKRFFRRPTPANGTQTICKLRCRPLVSDDGLGTLIPTP